MDAHGGCGACLFFLWTMRDGIASRDRGAVRSSFHTTINGLEGLRDYVEGHGPRAAEVLQAERSRLILLCLYLLNATVLIAHEIDAGYWHEWELLGIPGGIQVFLCLNLLLVIVVLYGHQALARGRASGFVFSWVLVAGGLLAAASRATSLLRGDGAFRLPVSLALRLATFALSLAQAASLLTARNIP